MNRLLKKRMLIVSISLAFLLLINIGVSYSYYLGKVVGNESDTTLSFKSAGIKIQYENNSGDVNVGDIMPGWSATKNFSLSSNILETDFTNDQTKLWYEIILYIDQNNFPSNLITYTLTPSETIVGNGKLAEARANVGIETGTNESGISLGLGYFTVGSNKHDYSITFNYVDIGSDYNNFPDSSFSVHIGAKAVVSSSIIIDLDGGSIEGTTTKYVSKGGTIVLPIPTKEGFIFDSWAITSGEGVIDGNNVTVNSDVLNIYAVWRSKSIPSVLVLDLDGGTSTQDTINDIKTGEIQTLENPTRPGYIFRGWELVSGDAEISGNKLVAYDESVKIIAIWEFAVPDFTYTGTYTLLNDTPDNWRIKFLTSGTLTFSRLGNAEDGIDVFLVGGGGAGSGGCAGSSGGGGGYTKTEKAYNIMINTSYKVTIGSGGARGNCYNGSDGGSTSAFSYTANGGSAGKNGIGGSGGSGGGGGGTSAGVDGGDGKTNGYKTGGSGQGSTTREFGESGGTLYSSGGKGGGGASGAANTGDGGQGGNSGETQGGNGGSGIVIIRNFRE